MKIPQSSVCESVFLALRHNTLLDWIRSYATVYLIDKIRFSPQKPLSPPRDTYAGDTVQCRVCDACYTRGRGVITR